MLAPLLKRIDTWKRLGCKESPDGSRLIGHTPRDFPEAYLHYFFSPRSKQEWQSYGILLPRALQELYSECNGLSLFHDSIAIYGMRTHYLRDVSAQFQPFDLITHNNEHRNSLPPLPDSSTDERVFFGSYKEDGSGICVIGDSPEVYRLVPGKSTPSNEWSSIKTFLESEFDRISKLFTSEGYQLRESIRIVPDGRIGK